jgi:RNA polymerase sigma-70 factor, ECF subfamily
MIARNGLAAVATPLPPAASAARPGRGLAGVSDEEVTRLRRHLTRAVGRVCPRWLADRAEDIVQAALMKLLEVLAEGEAERNSSYVWKVAYTATVDEIRRHRRRREVPLEEDDGPELPQREASGDPERWRAAREIGLGIQDCLGRLIEPRRLAVALHLQGHSVPEAARVLGWKSKNVENLVYRGLADLRRCLAAKGLKP